jgi:hypothetical protein
VRAGLVNAQDSHDNIPFKSVIMGKVDSGMNANGGEVVYQSGNKVGLVFPARPWPRSVAPHLSL